jgi:heme-degrading monooxygenase HmoA
LALMIAVIFEVWPQGAWRDEYLRMAAELKSELQAIDGFISIERFDSLSEPGKLLSLSFWRDEQAITAWRNLEAHRSAQRRGRSHVFADYRLRVADVVRDYGKSDRREVPRDSKDVHDRDE